MAIVNSKLLVYQRVHRKKNTEMATIVGKMAIHQQIHGDHFGRKNHLFRRFGSW